MWTTNEKKSREGYILMAIGAVVRVNEMTETGCMFTSKGTIGFRIQVHELA